MKKSKFRVNFLQVPLVSKFIVSKSRNIRISLKHMHSNTVESLKHAFYSSSSVNNREEERDDDPLALLHNRSRGHFILSPLLSS